LVLVYFSDRVLSFCLGLAWIEVLLPPPPRYLGLQA
jgi:hypothetical protein